MAFIQAADGNLETNLCIELIYIRFIYQFAVPVECLWRLEGKWSEGILFLCPSATDSSAAHSGRAYVKFCIGDRVHIVSS